MQIAQLRGGFGWAVYLCDNYEQGGFSDWFVPSRDELNFIYGNLYLNGLVAISDPDNTDRQQAGQTLTHTEHGT
jgi:hypothetical protein